MAASPIVLMSQTGATTAAREIAEVTCDALEFLRRQRLPELGETDQVGEGHRDLSRTGQHPGRTLCAVDRLLEASPTG